jgi:hypothetical protein
MIPVPSGVQVWLVVQETLKRNPLFAKRLERGRFVWPFSVPRSGADAVVTMTPAQLGY